MVSCSWHTKPCYSSTVDYAPSTGTSTDIDDCTPTNVTAIKWGYSSSTTVTNEDAKPSCSNCAQRKECRASNMMCVSVRNDLPEPKEPAPIVKPIQKAPIREKLFAKPVNRTYHKPPGGYGFYRG